MHGSNGTRLWHITIQTLLWESNAPNLHMRCYQETSCQLLSLHFLPLTSKQPYILPVRVPLQSCQLAGTFLGKLGSVHWLCEGRCLRRTNLFPFSLNRDGPGSNSILSLLLSVDGAAHPYYPLRWAPLSEDCVGPQVIIKGLWTWSWIWVGKREIFLGDFHSEFSICVFLSN